MVYFQVDLKYKQFEGKGTGPCSVVTVESWERDDREQDMHNSAVWKDVKQKRGCKMKDFATIKTPHGQKMTYTGQNNRANFKRTKFTIIHIRWFCSFFHWFGTLLEQISVQKD